MKRGKIIFILFALSILIINFVSALDLHEGMSEAFNIIKSSVEPVVSFLLGGNLEGGALFTKLLIFIIILSLIWIGTEKTNLLKDHRIIQKILAGVISILAIQGISYGFLDSITLPYTAVGIALSAGFPFILYFLILHVGFGQELTPIARRIAWIFFAVIFFGLVASKIGGVLNLIVPSSWGLYWIYMATAIAALICAFMDGTIRGGLAKFEAERMENVDKAELLAEFLKKKKDYKPLKDFDRKTYDFLMKRLRTDAKRAGIKRRL